jgi:type I restriction enzyme S subunit
MTTTPVMAATLPKRTVPPYPGYKSSGIQWVGDIPQHWKVQRIKHTTYVKGRIGWQNLRFDEFTEEGPYLVTGTDFANGKVNWDTCYHISRSRYDEDPYIQLKENDLLITKDGSIGKVAVVQGLPGPASLNSGIFLTRVKRGAYETRFMYWLLNSSVFTSFIDILKSGTTIDHLYQHVFVEFAYPVPTPDEQCAIATFLDRETTKIVGLISKRKELIVLLEEKRAALISRAVTKGPDPTVPMKDSGIEWLGEIPVHWAVKKLKHLAHSLQTGPFGTQLHAGEYIEDGIPVINPANLDEGTIAPDFKCTVDQTTFDRLLHHRLNEGDIVFARRGEMGRCALVTEKEDGWLCGTGCVRVRLDTKRSYPPFVSRLLAIKGAKDWFKLESVGSTMENLNTEIIGRIPLAVPDVNEQRHIADVAATLCCKIEAIKTKNREAIEALQEYRTALISAAVTGKIDVRGEVQ